MSYSVGWYYGNPRANWYGEPGDLSDTENYDPGTEGGGESLFPGNDYFAGIYGLLGGETVVWSGVWTPLGADPSPVFLPPDGGPAWALKVHTAGYEIANGALVLRATVNGIELPDYLTLTLSEHDSFYLTVAWIRTVGSTPGGGGDEGGGGAESCSTALSFPPSLPMPTIAGFSSSHEVAASSTEPDFGPNRVRPLYTNVPRKVSAQWEFHDYQFLRFDRWYLDTVQNGTEKFDVMLSNDDDGSMWWNVCFAKPWSVEQVQPGNMWRVSADLYLYCGFDVRPFYGNLDGIATLGLSATGNLSILKHLLGFATLDLTAAGTLSGRTATLYGAADAMTLVATAIFGAVSTGPLWGLATMDYALTARLAEITYELREDGGDELREDGGREQRES